jgi:acetolactate synthase-1/2/3 large subunit
MVQITGGQAFAEMLEGYGTTHVFFVPAVMLKTFAELAARGIKPVSAHGEKAAAYMADGYARVAGRPGFCMAQAVGASNLAAGLKDAAMAGSPVIAITGGPYPDRQHRHVYQELDDRRMFDAVTKWSTGVPSADLVPEILRQAFRVATTGNPGPVFLEARGHAGEVFDDEADLSPLVEPRFAATPPFRPVPDDDSLRQALEVLAAAERPVIVAGGGVTSSGAGEELVALAEMLDIPVATSLNAKNAIRDDHPLAVGSPGTYARRCANQIVSEADLVFFIGSHTGGLVTNNWRIPARGTRVIHLDIDPAELGRVYPAAVALHGDARAGLARLAELAEPRANPAWREHVATVVSAWWDLLTPEILDAVPIRPERICLDLGTELPDDAVVVADTLQAGLWTGSYLRLSSPRQQFIRCAGSLGWGLPASVGAACAAGDRPTVCFTGDGGLYYHLAELETAARYGLNLVVVVNNNGAYGGERNLWSNAFSDSAGEAAPDMWTFGDIDFAEIGQRLGCSGVRVHRPEEIRPAIAKAIGSGGPWVVDVISDPGAIADKGW